MSEKIIRFPKPKTERPEDIFKVGVHVNLKGNLGENYMKSNIIYYEIKDDLLTMNMGMINKEKLFKDAFGISWKIASVDFVNDEVKIQTKINGFNLEMLVRPFILRVSNKAIDKKG